VNTHRAHDYRFLIQRWRAVARKSGTPLRPLAMASGYPLFFLTSKALPASGGMYLSAGIHGDEPGSTEGLIAWAEENAERIRELPLLILPCLNPWGLVHNQRLDETGFDLNRSFHREDLPVIAAVRNLVAPYRFEAVVHLHEDYDGQGLYLYEVGPARSRWGESLIRAASAHIPIEGRIWVDGRKAHGGLIRPRLDMKKYDTMGFPEALWLRLHHARHALTIEAPSEFGLDQRIRALRAVIEECVRRMCDHPE
jgi:protein MpaA